ncbi:MAG TPA: Xaa-Pro peptidase family protein [Gaiellales bacterium]|nr:Xaa-Pro peptidase family protein [Gaiellales bacterium]
MNHAARLARLSDALAAHEVDALLVTDLVNVRYLTGYTGSNGAVVARPDGAVFLTDFRYLERVAPLRAYIEVQQATQDLIRHVGSRWAELGPGASRIGFEAEHLSVAALGLLSEAAGPVELVPLTGVVEHLRVVKDDDEVAAIRRSAAVLETIYERIAGEGLAGRREVDVAWRVHELLHEMGATGLSFDPIVASGDAGALPHAEPRDRAIERGDLVTLDIGGVLDGYCSDCTRTFATGPVADDLAEAYDLVLRAQLAALDAVRPGVTGVDADAAARDVIEAAGHGGHFQHGTGHGVGLQIHEAPRLSPTSTATLEQGMIVTVEPGVYLPGRGGVRIEDLVVVTADGCERLTGYPKELITTG